MVARRRLPSLVALRAFEAVARVGSMKEASNELNVTPGAISQLIRKLEDELSICLFERKNREIKLTEEGKQLKSGAVDAFNMLKETVCSLGEESNRNTISVACNRIIANNWLSPRMSGLLKLNLSSDLKMVSLGQSKQHISANPDIVLTIEPRNDDAFEYACVGCESFSVMASPSYLQHFGDSIEQLLSNATLLKYELEGDHITSKWEEVFHITGHESERCQEIDFGLEFDQAMTAAVSGAGLILAPINLVSSDIASGRLVMPLELTLRSNIHYWLGHTKALSDNHDVALMRSWFKNSLRDSFELDDVEKSPAIAEMPQFLPKRLASVIMSEAKEINNYQQAI